MLHPNLNLFIAGRSSHFHVSAFLSILLTALGHGSLFRVTELPSTLQPYYLFRPFSPFFALVPTVPELYSYITIRNTVYTFQVSIKSILSMLFHVIELP